MNTYLDDLLLKSPDIIKQILEAYEYNLNVEQTTSKAEIFINKLEKQRNPETKSHKKSKKFLVIEDDEASSKMLSMFLNNYGYCDTALDGEKGLEAYFLARKSDHPYDLICLDIMMPVLDGQEVLKQIREYERSNNIRSLDESKILMITALNTPKEALKAYFKGGCNEYLTKPLSMERLKQVLIDYGIA
ncbi:response regulator receiver protein [Candidatus Magnetoovum chiemensis]|nr:response regulator receiver protein [Candidatus Magnetoovum chiemensis]